MFSSSFLFGIPSTLLPQLFLKLASLFLMMTSCHRFFFPSFSFIWFKEYTFIHLERLARYKQSRKLWTSNVLVGPIVTLQCYIWKIHHIVIKIHHTSSSTKGRIVIRYSAQVSLVMFEFRCCKLSWCQIPQDIFRGLVESRHIKAVLGALGPTR